MGQERTTRGRMGRVQQLPAPVRAELDRLLATGLTQKEILGIVNRELAALGGKPLGAAVLNRYASQQERAAGRMRDANAMAAAWTKQLGEAPEGDLGEMLGEMLKTLAYDVQLRVEGSLDRMDAPEAATLVKELALTHRRMEAAGLLTQRRRRETLADAARAAGKALKRHNVSQEVRAAIDKAILGEGGNG